MTFSASRRTIQARDRRVEAFQLLRIQGLSSKAPPSRSARRFGDEDAARLGQRLQASGQIGRLADDGLFLRRALSDEVADDNDPRRDADPRLSGVLSRARLKLGDRPARFSPARTARSASSSCARGKPK